MESLAAIEERRTKYWKQSKGLSTATTVTIIILIIAQVYAFGGDNHKLTVLEDKVVELEADIIHASTVKQMFENKDLEIKGIHRDIEAMQKNMSVMVQDTKENQKLLIRIIERLPKQ